MARTRRAAAAVIRQFLNRDVVKLYHAIVSGWISCPEGATGKPSDFLDIEIPIAERYSKFEVRRKRIVSMNETRQTDRASNAPSWYAQPKPARTRIWSLQRGYFQGIKCTLLQIQIFTGRTHQIRVHLALLGYPILGDKMYGEKEPPASVFRMFLHSYHLKFPELNLSFTEDSGFAELIEPAEAVQ
eukprot:gnl/MRDRNA2_/MRDRNA2_80468_c0_seq2.p1 gnl/MRDRNA2_/MRDRNA2_80468_c0~~gnl/MRDRNA2_/MRDRNA2_80468_c0_seq2.p1  ORF type:complete len:218 (+),score=20.13 gnl/MRDRNA2_/MRDRNA2_80468_c0_seq2:99-656(+)